MRALATWLLFGTLLFAARAKHVVLVSGDEEYRSEEALPQLARILRDRHGFRCTVLFAIDPATGFINPDVQTNIPGLEALETADLMIIATRFRNLPDEQMRHIVRFVEAGKPIIGLRTATHAFALTQGSYRGYSWNNSTGGFGRKVLGETWIRHHGQHGVQSTRGVFAAGAAGHPILKGIESGELWSPTDVYETRLPLLDVTPLVLGQVLTGMKQDDAAAEGAVNDPMRPIAWVPKSSARIFTTTMGAAEDLLNPAFRRMLVNACYWALGLESKILPKLNVALVGEFHPSHFGFGQYIKGRKP